MFKKINRYVIVKTMTYLFTVGEETTELKELKDGVALVEHMRT